MTITVLLVIHVHVTFEILYEYVVVMLQSWQSFPTCKHTYIWKSKIFLEIDKLIVKINKAIFKSL